MLKFHSALVVLLFMFGLLHQVQADIPRVIHHEGYLTDASGAAITDNLSATFSLYGSSIGGPPLHTEQSSIVVDGGYFSVKIGESSPLPTHSPLFLGIAIDGESEMSPRVELHPVPFALVAHEVEVDSDTLSNLSCASSDVPQWDGAQWLCANVSGGEGTVGPQGPKGDTGTQGLTGETGTQGDKGDQGDVGLSAYQVWLSPDNTGTEADYLASLVGDAGPQGATGPQGLQGPKGDQGNTGTDGLSAYQVWINAGNSGAEADYLASLVGVAGTQGLKGDAGPQGATGSQGDTGATGPSGTSSWSDSDSVVSTDSTVYVTTDNVGAIRATVTSAGGGAIVAQNTATTGYGFGVMGATSSETGAGLLASSNSTSGENFGVFSLHNSDDGAAVFGHARSTSGSTHGGFFKNESPDGTGVVGAALSVSGETKGGEFSSYSPDGFAFMGVSRSTTGGRGVWGGSLGVGGVGVSGVVDSLDSSGVGVLGTGLASVGVGGYTASGSALAGSASLNSGVSLYLESVGGLLIDGRYDGNNDKIYTQYYKVSHGGDVTASNHYTWSSRRWKDNIQPLSSALNAVLQLQGTTYDSTRSGVQEVGFIAEDIGAVIPQIVQWEENGIDAAGVDYARLTPYLVEAIKSQQSLIESLTQRIEQLENQ